MRVIDPAPAVAKQAKRLLEAQGMKSPAGGRAEVRLYTSGEVAPFTALLPKLLGESGAMSQVIWLDDHRIEKAQSPHNDG